MSDFCFRVGDLVGIDPDLDQNGLYLELKSSVNKTFYSMPRQVVQPDELMVVLGVDENDVHIFTPSGKKGWIAAAALVLVSRVNDGSEASG